MSMVKKVFAVFLLFHLIALTIQSCCSRPETYSITLNSLTKIESYWISSKAGNSNFDPNQKVMKGDTLHFSTQIIDSSYTNYAYNSSVGLISGAYAHTCEEDDYISSNSVTDIKIYTQRDFDEAHYRNDEITEYFNLYHYGQYYSLSESSSHTYLDIKNKSDLPGSSELVFSLIKQPTADSLQQFLLAFTMSDGQILQDTTATILFDIEN